MPVVANGDLFSLTDCKKICEEAKVRGVMCARGLLANPAMFADYDHTPIECINDWIDICMKSGTAFHYFHQTLSQMLTNVLSKSDRRYFNTLISTSSVLDYLNKNVLLK
jgi:tRNA-dihydrouridine synthase 4